MGGEWSGENEVSGELESGVVSRGEWGESGVGRMR